MKIKALTENKLLNFKFNKFNNKRRREYLLIIILVTSFNHNL